MKKNYLLWGFGAMLSISSLQAQSKLFVNLTNSIKKEYDFSAIRKLTFKNGSLQVEQKVGVVDETPLSSIGYLNFSQTPITTSLEEAGSFDSKSVLLHPNPFNGHSLELSYYAESTTSAKIELLNMAGKVETKFLQDARLGRNDLSLELPNLQAGLYVCRVTVGDRIVNAKVVKY